MRATVTVPLRSPKHHSATQRVWSKAKHELCNNKVFSTKILSSSLMGKKQNTSAAAAELPVALFSLLGFFFFKKLLLPGFSQSQQFGYGIQPGRTDDGTFRTEVVEWRPCKACEGSRRLSRSSLDVFAPRCSKYHSGFLTVTRGERGEERARRVSVPSPPPPLIPTHFDAPSYLLHSFFRISKAFLPASNTLGV